MKRHYFLILCLPLIVLSARADIRDWLVAEMGEVSVEAVAEYLAALESIGVLKRIVKEHETKLGA